MKTGKIICPTCKVELVINGLGEEDVEEEVDVECWHCGSEIAVKVDWTPVLIPRLWYER